MLKHSGSIWWAHKADLSIRTVSSPLVRPTEQRTSGFWWMVLCSQPQTASPWTEPAVVTRLASSVLFVKRETTLVCCMAETNSLESRRSTAGSESWERRWFCRHNPGYWIRLNHRFKPKIQASESLSRINVACIKKIFQVVIPKSVQETAAGEKDEDAAGPFVTEWDWFHKDNEKQNRSLIVEVKKIIFRTNIWSIYFYSFT